MRVQIQKNGLTQRLEKEDFASLQRDRLTSKERAARAKSEKKHLPDREPLLDESEQPAPDLRCLILTHSGCCCCCAFS